MAKSKSKKQVAYDVFMSGTQIDGVPVSEPSIVQAAKAANAHPQYIMNVATRENWVAERERIHNELAVRPAAADLAIEEQHEVYRAKRREFLQKEDEFLEKAQVDFQKQVALGKQGVRGFRDYGQISIRRDKILAELAGEEKSASDQYVAMMLQLDILVENKQDTPANEPITATTVFNQPGEIVSVP